MWGRKKRVGRVKERYEERVRKEEENKEERRVGRGENRRRK